MTNLSYLMVFIKYQIFKIILSASLKIHETVLTNPPIHIYMNRINNILVFKIYKLEL